MTRLPQPTTTSPGFLVLVYTMNGIAHKIRQRVISGVDITDATAMAAKAGSWASLLADCMSDLGSISGYVVQNPSGVELFSGAFSPVIPGTISSSGQQVAQSFTLDLVGRGAPGGGLAQGNTRHMWFLGVMPSTIDGPRIDVPPSTNYSDLEDFLNADTVIGADIYGTKAVFQSYMDAQINAHYQKRYGL